MCAHALLRGTGHCVGTKDVPTTRQIFTAKGAKERNVLDVVIFAFLGVLGGYLLLIFFSVYSVPLW